MPAGADAAASLHRAARWAWLRRARQVPHIDPRYVLRGCAGRGIRQVGFPRRKIAVDLYPTLHHPYPALIYPIVSYRILPYPTLPLPSLS